MSRTSTEPHSRRTVDAGTGSRSVLDADLLALVSRGDLGALGVIYDRHVDAAWRLALHFSASPAAAEQAVAAAFLRLWRNPEPKHEFSLPARLLSSVEHEVHDSQQVPRGQRMSSSSDSDHPPLMATVNEAIDRLHTSLDLADSEFHCECGHSGCRERLTLTRAEYAGLVEESRPLIAPVHADRESAATTELRELRGQVQQLQESLASRVRIEQAKGVLVERHGMTPDGAFEALRQRARDQRRSLDEVCAQIVDWAGIPEAEQSEPAPSHPQQSSRERHGR